MVITMIRPEGVWQSVDYRVMIGKQIKDDTAPKQLHIICPPLDGGPQVFLGFTGLAVLSDGTPTQRWLRETLRGEPRPIMQMFDHMKDRLTRDVGSSSLWRTPLVFSGGIFEGSRRLYVEVRNVDPKTWLPKRQFDYVIIEIAQPKIFIGGSGLYAIDRSDLSLLTAQAQIRPAKWEDHLGLLAGVNRRTAAREKSVSPWCQATFLSSETPAAQAKIFAKPGEPELIPAVETLLAGIDVSEPSRLLAQHMLDVRAGKNTPMPDTSAAAQRSIEGRP